MKRMCLGLALLSCVLFISGCASSGKIKSAADGIKSVQTIAESFGDGQKVSTVIVEYAKKIDASSVSVEDFAVEGQEIKSVFVSNKAEKTDENVDGKYVVINLKYTNKWDATNGQMPVRASKSEEDASGPRFDDEGTPVDLTATVTQVGDVSAKDGTVYTASAESAVSTKSTELVIQDFAKKSFTDSETGITLPYYIYLPEGYSTKTEYPILFFIPDASADTNIDSATLTQGNGATIWATPEEQAKHPSIIVAIQYPLYVVKEFGMLTGDSNTWTTGLTAVENLIHSVLDSYSVDMKRVYGAGQSQGCMSNIALSDKDPALFTAQFLVAGQWNIEEMAAMKDKNLWIVVCTGDTKAYPGMNAATDLWESLGSKVIRSSGTWNPKAPAEEIEGYIADMKAQDGNIHYSVIEGGSHMYTWTLAYYYEGIRDWLFEQSK